MSKLQISYAPNIELVIDHRGITDYQAGQAADKVGPGAIILKHCQVYKIRSSEIPGIEASAAGAARRGKVALKKWILENVLAVDVRAQRFEMAAINQT